MIWILVLLSIIFMIQYGLIAFKCNKYQILAEDYKNRLLESQQLGVDLELATTQQIIEELRKRPNFSCVFLFPNGNGVDTLISRLSPDTALMLLKTSFHGISKIYHPEDEDYE